MKKMLCLAFIVMVGGTGWAAEKQSVVLPEELNGVKTAEISKRDIAVPAATAVKVAAPAVKPAAVKTAKEAVGVKGRQFTCYAGMPTLTFHNVMASDSDSAVSIAKQLCYAAAAPGWKENCYNAYAKCNDTGPAQQLFTCYAGMPTLTFHDVAAPDAESAKQMAKQLCYAAAAPGWKENCYNAYSVCNKQ